MKKSIIKAINFSERLFNIFRSNESVFSDIYTKKRWYSTENNGEFNSGAGSDSGYSIPYIEAVSHYISENNINSIVDLGCGDFRVGKRLLDKVSIDNYTGIDVVKDLVEYNNTHYGNRGKIDFLHKDITKDILPLADLYLVRQVFQHLSNNDILKALNNIPHSSRLIVTEHQQINTTNIVPNLDKIRGGDIRVSKKSAVFLNKPPFSLNVNVLGKIDINEKECLRIFEVFR